MVAAKAKAVERPAAGTKLIIRRLPPTLPADIFWKSVSTWINGQSCHWKVYVPGHTGEGHDGYATYSRAYVLLNAPETVVEFTKNFNGHVFRSKAGVEYQAVIELSPVQKTPVAAKPKADARQGTIDNDPDYLSFIESLNAPITKAVPEPAATAGASSAQPTSTPLLDHLRQHGIGSRKGQGKSVKSTESSSDVTARRAIASISAAAEQRGKHNKAADTGLKMIAGKGRDVIIAPTEQADASNADGKKKKVRSKREGGAGVGQATKAESTKSSAAGGDSQTKKPRGGAAANAYATERTSIKSNLEAQSNRTSGPDDKSGKAIDRNDAGRGRARGRGGGGRGGEPAGSSSVRPIGEVATPGEGAVPTGPTTGARDGLRRGRGRGGGKIGEGGDRSAHATVISILSRNNENGANANSSGTRGGRSRGRGGSTPVSGFGPGASITTVTASAARIDD